MIIESDIPTWARPSPKGGWIIVLKAKPGASRTQFEIAETGGLSAKIAAPPVDGKANKTLIAALAKRLGVARTRMTIVRGETGREKSIHIDHESPDWTGVLG